MKRLWFILFVLISNVNSQQTLAVVDFDGKGVTDIEASALTDRFAIELFNLNVYRLIERDRVGEILEEQGLQQSGCTSSECAVEIGKLLGTELIITGSISKVGNVYSVSSRIINVESGEISKMSNYDYQGQIGQLLMTGMRVAVKKLVNINSELVEFSESKPVEFLESNSAEINYDYGRKCIEYDKCLNPEYYFNKSLIIDSTFAPAYFALGQIELSNDNISEAIKYMIEAVIIDPENMAFRNEYYMWSKKYSNYNFPELPPKPEVRVKFIPYDDPPVPLSPIRPKYPEIAQEAEIEGTVVVQVFIDNRGRVKDTVILKGIPNTGLDKAATKAIRAVRFKPARQKERAVGVWISIPVNFRLK